MYVLRSVVSMEFNNTQVSMYVLVRTVIHSFNQIFCSKLDSETVWWPGFLFLRFPSLKILHCVLMQFSWHCKLLLCMQDFVEGNGCVFTCLPVRFSYHKEGDTLQRGRHPTKRETPNLFTSHNPCLFILCPWLLSSHLLPIGMCCWYPMACIPWLPCWPSD